MERNFRLRLMNEIENGEKRKERSKGEISNGNFD